MAYSYVQYTGDGSTTAFTFAFEGQDEGYIRKEDIVATVDGVDAPFSLLSSNTLEFTDVPSNGSEILIRRVMPKSVPYADFQRGNNFGQDALNNSFLQLLYVVHELLDGWVPEGYTVKRSVDFLEDLRSLNPNPDDPDSVVTFGSGDARYVNLTGDEMQGSLNMDSYPVFVRIAVNGNEPARKDELDTERDHRKSADANLQAQISDTQPLEASAFSPISWHKQVIENSVEVPEEHNAWSFGPEMVLSNGSSVTVPEGSYWTVTIGDTNQ